MEALKELAYIVNKNKLKSIEVLDTSKNNRITAFYEAILNNHFETEEEAIAHFFPDTQNKAPYRKLKSTLKKRLVNSLFFIDVKKPGYNDRQQAYFQCHKDWAAARMLLGKNAWKSSVEICERILKYALKYEFTEMALDLLRILRLNYSTRLGDITKFEEYKRLFQEYEQIMLADNKAELLYSELVMHYVRNISTKENLQQQAIEYYEALRPNLSQFDSYKLHLYGSMIKLMIYTIVNDYTTAAEVCDEIIEFFEKKPYDANTPLQIAYYQKLVCYSQLRQFEKGKDAAQRCISLIEEGNVNWFKYYELYFLLAMHTSNYQEAYEVLNGVTNHARYAFLPSHMQEIWTIYEAYIHYLVNIGKVKPSANDGRFTKFRLGRFLNDTPIFSKDKRGMNVAILSIQILFLIQEKKYYQAIDRLEAIEKYCNRYLRRGDTMRSYYFIKMLLSIAEASFHRQAVIRKSGKHAEKLESIPLETAHQPYKVEIIPYEQLWMFALNSLEEKIYKYSG
ncbi:MAG: hypothetical protein KDD19_20340 [Phaeodactylibacter sp.]|nr:hypothetical protein [Phaeodactylibacter sp.]MCB9053532.1 hypothetical protein [Lewinellaceae bacterium]